MQIRRTLFAGAAAGMAALAVLSTATAAGAAPAAKHHVLTIGKVGGAAVKTNATLKASLKKGTNAVFASGAMTLTCSKSTFTSKVTKNPTAPGTASEKVTKQTVGGCTISGVSGISIVSVTVTGLPYKSTVSTKKGFPVTVSNAATTIVVSVQGVTGNISCTYRDKTLKGNASNKHQTISFSKQTFTLDTKVSNGLCTPSTGTFSATYGPVKDTSVKHSPSVFVN